MVSESRKLLVISDIHSNIIALEAVLKDAEQHGPFTDKVCAGDIIGYNANPAECVERMIADDFIVIAGNHDRKGRGENLTNFNYDAAQVITDNMGELNPKAVQYLKSLKNSYVDPKFIFAMAHGSFGKGREDKYIFHDEDAFDMLWWGLLFDDSEGESVHVPVGIVGHTHRPMYVSGWFNYNERPHSGMSLKNGVTKLKFNLHKPNPDRRSGFLDLETRSFKFDLSDKPKQTRYPDPWSSESDENEPEDNPYCHPKILVNPGSVGQPRHGSVAACYAIVDITNDSITTEFRTVQYDIEEMQKRMKEKDFPKHFISRLSDGS